MSTIDQQNSAAGAHRLLCNRALQSLLLCVSIGSAAAASATHWQSLQSIESAALQHAENHRSGTAVRVEARVKALDQRLKLARCGEALETFTPSSAAGGATQIIGVRCHRPKPWKVYVPVRTAVYQQVIVANRPLAKGDTLSSDDVRLDERDVSRLPGKYLTDIAQLKDRVLKRDVRDQAIISSNLLDAEDIVQRGQNVTLMARSSKLNVRMRGEAMTTAALNERVRVKNLTSRRIVEGVVVSRQLVLVDH